MWSCAISILFSIYMFSWTRSSHLLKISNRYGKNFINVVLIVPLPDISLSSPCFKNHYHACHQQDCFLFYTTVFFLYVWIHISKISQIYTTRNKIQAYNLKIYVTTYFQILSRIILSMFLYLLGLYFVSSCMWKFSTYLKKMVRCWNPLWVDSWFNRIDSSQNNISHPIQKQILNTTWRSTSKIS